MSNPEDLRYTKEHEWTRQEGSKIVFGITDYAQEHLGSVVHVDFPAVGATISFGEPCAEIESTKSVSEIYAPANGTVVAVNDAVDDAPEMVNDDPYGDGWLITIEVSQGVTVPSLLSAAEYELYLATLPDQ